MILLVEAVLACTLCFATGLAVGRFILVNRNIGEALVANTFAWLNRAPPTATFAGAQT
jgi:hypothetical protein